MTSTDTTPAVGTAHLEALQRRHQKYAVKFVLDAATGEEASDANLARVLAGCARTPRSDEYPAIRMHVDTYRMAQMSGTDAVRDTLRERADSYARDASRFREMGGEHEKWAPMYGTIARELRLIADEL